MLTCYPQLLSNFIYRSPSPRDLLSLEASLDLIRFVVSRDLTIAAAFCRRFAWTELQLWPGDLPPRSLVVLSGRDDLVPSALVEAHLAAAAHPARVMHHPALGHGGLLMSPAWQAEVVAALAEMVAGEEEEGEEEELSAAAAAPPRKRGA